MFECTNVYKYSVSKKGAHFPKLKNISDLLSDDKEGKIVQNINI